MVFGSRTSGALQHWPQNSHCTETKDAKRIFSTKSCLSFSRAFKVCPNNASVITKAEIIDCPRLSHTNCELQSRRAECSTSGGRGFCLLFLLFGRRNVKILVATVTYYLMFAPINPQSKTLIFFLVLFQDQFWCIRLSLIHKNIGIHVIYLNGFQGRRTNQLYNFKYFIKVLGAEELFLIQKVIALDNH